MTTSIIISATKDVVVQKSKRKNLIIYYLKGVSLVKSL